MKLTGKCKAEFREFYNNRPINGVYHTNYSVFMSKSMSEQIGVYVDFFDSVNLFVEVIVVEIDDFSFQIFKKESAKSLSNGFTFNTRPEARAAAIEKANELHNEFLNK